MIRERTPLNFLLKALQEAGHEASEIVSAKSVGGGSINEALKLETDAGPYFVKTNSASRYPGMFEVEIKGLEYLKQPRVIRIPDPIANVEEGDDAYLLMEYIEEGNSSAETWEKFGRQLADLHQQSSEHFGLDHDNYIGSLPQSNTPKNTWSEFFATERIEPQLRMAESHFSSGDRRKFDQLLSKLESLVPEEQPALLHGDLWSGNYLIDENGKPVLIDPAVYYGHREVDLAMMHLFGGFPAELFEHYHQHFPLENGWRERIDLHNLYPLMVHVNLFGSVYAGQVHSILSRFS